MRPPLALDAETVASFDRLLAASLAATDITSIAYALPTPKWQFLCYLCERKNLVLHGSGDPDIALLEPRKSNDAIAFGNREAVYAAADGIWPIFFAIVNRSLPVTSLVNSCVRIVAPPGMDGDPYYFFSIAADERLGSPWRDGTVYLLPGETFERQEIKRQCGLTIESAQVASLTPVRPLAKLAVTPTDFPFLDRVRRHDAAVLRQRAAADPDGFPWLDEP